MSRISHLGDFPRPSLAVDPAVLSVENGRLLTLLWKRTGTPEQGQWALPGVFVGERESLEAAVGRALSTKANLAGADKIEQLLTWNKIGRDPRGWVVTVAYYVLVPIHVLRSAIKGSTGLNAFEVIKPASAASPTRLLDANGCEVLPAFDHAEILSAVIERLRSRLWTSTAALDLLPRRFTLREAQLTYQAILNTTLNKDSFRRRVTKTQRLVRPTGKFQLDVGHRPAELFTRS